MSSYERSIRPRSSHIDQHRLEDTTQAVKVGLSEDVEEYATCRPHCGGLIMKRLTVTGGGECEPDQRTRSTRTAITGLVNSGLFIS